MKKISRYVCFFLLLVMTTEVFAKGTRPNAYAMEAFKTRMLEKLSSYSVDERESVVYKLYRSAVKAQNKLQAMGSAKVLRKLTKSAPSDVETSEELSEDDEMAVELVTGNEVPVIQYKTVSESDVDNILTSAKEQFLKIGTQVNEKGRMKALSRNQFHEATASYFYGDGDWSGVGEALVALFVAILVILAVAAVAIIGLAGAAFGVTGAVIAAGVIGVGVLIFLRG